MLHGEPSKNYLGTLWVKKLEGETPMLYSKFKLCHTKSLMITKNGNTKLFLCLNFGGVNWSFKQVKPY
jgi:hypothetical protein